MLTARAAKPRGQGLAPAGDFPRSNVTLIVTE